MQRERSSFGLLISTHSYYFLPVRLVCPGSASSILQQFRWSRDPAVCGSAGGRNLELSRPIFPAPSGGVLMGRHGSAAECAMDHRTMGRFGRGRFGWADCLRARPALLIRDVSSGGVVLRSSRNGIRRSVSLPEPGVPQGGKLASSFPLRLNRGATRGHGKEGGFLLVIIRGV